jgi:hypothetical protein
MSRRMKRPISTASAVSHARVLPRGESPTALKRRRYVAGLTPTRPRKRALNVTADSKPGREGDLVNGHAGRFQQILCAANPGGQEPILKPGLRTCARIVDRNIHSLDRLPPWKWKLQPARLAA